ncbi:S41 family peptidase [Chitinophaga niabensis]|uniref:N-terminal domain of Peptidase_S41 n=1 Tax=Chitinophaga niabensis TaxID=536979 RepID=A0A1N6FN26_9BACT|nr:S41 family peptidase [Chitinophaga niabensis]SIN96646.1 N-terminal domain of Peptidase_S41 [Chitinophaga niabensis]
MKGIILIIILSTGFAQAQQTVIEKTAQLIKAHYVSEEKGAKIAEHLLQQYKAGTFNTKPLDSVVTAVLQRFSHDGHLYLRYDPQPLKEEESDENLFYYGPKAIENNYGFREVKVLDGNIGYIKLSEINISDKSLPLLYAAMRFVTNTKALIIDLQYNGGGGSNIGAVLESYFLPKNTQLLEFKSRTGGVEVERTVTWLTEERYNKPLYILVNGRTASAAEAFAYVLQARKRAKIVGQTSAGGANMNQFYRVNNEYYVSVSIAAPALPGTDSSWEQKGVQPDQVTQPGEEIKVVRELISADRTVTATGRELTSPGKTATGTSTSPGKSIPTATGTITSSGNTTTQPHSQ